MRYPGSLGRSPITGRRPCPAVVVFITVSLTMHPHTPSRRRFLQASAYGALAAAQLAQLPNLALADDQPAGGKKLGYAFVGLGRLAINQLLPALAESQHCKVTALVSGHPDKAKDLAGKYDVPEKNIYNYDNFDTIKDNPDIDVVYIVLPNSMHAEYTIRAAKAGKHVLCEKPMANTRGRMPADDRRLQSGEQEAHDRLPPALRAASHEGDRDRPATNLRQAADDQRRTLASTSAPTQWRTNKKLAGGGPLMDVGIYCLNFARYVSGEEPVTVSAQSFQDKSDPRFQEVESSMTFTLKFPSGALAACTTSYEHAGVSRFHYMTDRAIVQCDPAFGYGGLTMGVRSGNKDDMLDIPNINQFAAEIDHFAVCVTGDQTRGTPGEEGLRDLKIMMKLYESAATGKTVTV